MINEENVNEEYLSTTSDNDVQPKRFFVYLLESSISHSTYVGATVNLDRRIRQHNKELTGGAKATTNKVCKGELWSFVCYVSEFPDWKNALQFEWRFKQLGRKLPSNMKPIERRMQSLYKLINMEKSTSKATPYIQWKNKPIITFNCKQAEDIYNNL
jgi:predicted GIY-YIG superfamily endonuclease